VKQINLPFVASSPASRLGAGSSGKPAGYSSKRQMLASHSGKAAVPIRFWAIKDHF